MSIYYNNGSCFLSETKSRYLAIKPLSRAFRELIPEYYLACWPVDDTKICPPGVMTEKLKGSCLASLFMQDDELMHVCLLKQDSSLLSFENQTHYKRQIIEKLNHSFGLLNSQNQFVQKQS